jgi:hypothetical protein
MSLPNLAKILPLLLMAIYFFFSGCSNDGDGCKHNDEDVEGGRGGED